MSSIKYEIDGDRPFSRMKNHLIENQRWWPAYIKNDGSGGLTVDPVLFATNFGPLSTAEDGERMDESNQPGIRFELLNNDGTDPANPDQAKVTMVKSGTNGAALILEYPTNHEQVVMLVAPSAEGWGGLSVGTRTMPTGISIHESHPFPGGQRDVRWANQQDAVNVGIFDDNEQMTGRSYGPFPVYATLQDVVDIIDATNNTGIAFLPHGLPERDGAEYTFMPTYTNGVDTMQEVNCLLTEDNRAVGIGLYDNDGLTADVWRATVFMPMCLDVNQFSKSMTGTSGISEPRFVPADSAYSLYSFGGYAKGYLSNTYNDQRMDMTTRYDPNPTGPNASSLIWKTVGFSGDHKQGPGAGNKMAAARDDTLQQYIGDKTAPDHARMQQGFATGDSASCPNPKYRMRMCLAIFLKDGEYSPQDGCLIPYTYDSDRYIGGKNTVTAYDTWPADIGYDGRTAGLAGYTQPVIRDPNTRDTNNAAVRLERGAAIYPGFGFVQGPLAPAQQATNFDANAFLIPATTLEKTADGYGTWGSSTVNVSTWNIQTGNWGLVNNPMRAGIWTVELSASGVLTLRCPVNNISTLSVTARGFSAAEGMPVYIRGITVAGIGGSTVDNDWFLPVSKIRGGAVPTYGMEDNIVKSVNGWWVITSATSVSNHTFGSQTSDIMEIVIDTGQSGGAVAETEAGGQSNSLWQGAYIHQGAIHGAMFSDGDLSGSDSTSWNIYGGAWSGSQATSFYLAPLIQPGGATQHNNDLSFAPGRLTQRRSAFGPNGGMITNNTGYPLPTNAMPYNASDVTRPPAPNKSVRGQGSLLLPPGFGNVTSQYRGRWGESAAGDRTGSKYSDVGNNKLSSTWSAQVLMTPLWSMMCQETGRHAWDFIRPPGWNKGRNRPWPGHYRQGEAVANAPPLPMSLTIMDPYNVNRFGFKDRWDSSDGRWAATRRYGLREIACSPIWLDAEFVAYFPQLDNRLSLIEFDIGRSSVFGRNAFVTDLGELDAQGPFATEFGFRPLAESSSVDPNRTSPNANEKIRNPHTFITPRPVFWAWGGGSAFNTGDWQNATWPYSDVAGKATAGFGDLSVATGAGGNFAFPAGIHKVRAVFSQKGMTCLVDGKVKGTDPTSGSPVSQISIKSADFHCGNTTEDSNFGSATRISFQSQPPFKTQRQIGTQSMDFMQLDSMTLRHIPTRAMLPFRVETNPILPAANIAKFTSLQVEAENIAPTMKRDIRVNICHPGLGVQPVNRVTGSPLAGFENLDLAFAGGIGSVDLTDLPTGSLTNGFTIQWLFTIPAAEDEDLQPIDWNMIPIIRNWTVEYDLKPTVTLSVVGNTYNGDITPPIDTKVGHIVSFRADCATTDPDRKVKSVQFEFGDGTTTDFLPLTEGATATLDTAHTYISTGSGLIARARVKDDNDNLSDYSPTITVNVANAPPVAILRAVPSMIRAGQPVRLDATASYDVNAGGTVTNFTFTPGDGSAAVGPQGTGYADHTYATAGEYQATVTCEDADGTVSNTAKAVIKVLPATLVIPLTLNTMPSGFSRVRGANLTQTTVLDAVYPEVSDTGQRNDEFTLTGQFLRDTADADILFMEELLASGALVEFEWQAVNYAGVPDSKTFVGRMVSFDYSREGGAHGQTPYSASFIREAGLGA